ncbi:asparagine synthase-related protein [Candidatus Pseudothioglobus singularis]|nr:asparagine synthase-related protein [Candidatus Pseudothioglobus singularis]
MIYLKITILIKSLIECYFLTKDLLEALLGESRLRRERYFHVEPIRRKWEEYLSGHRNWKYYLCNILMFQAWLESNHG